MLKKASSSKGLILGGESGSVQGQLAMTAAAAMAKATMKCLWHSHGFMEPPSPYTAKKSSLRRMLDFFIDKLQRPHNINNRPKQLLRH
ncbi:hypothetical protein GUJ93_ZPchr0002g25404 [Zizania palustris]|uniref:Uncharacterized protein n=1 Tax=Zizania palustris TaxID=103762 RepID=A0A8J5VBX7_ZIZPA|nr:hypothetical protein GUJ93_ZPchr0002g25404 [Zizania palustris]